MRRNKKKKIIIISLIGILILMTVGYAAFQTNLQIKGTSKINSNWNVLITNVTKSNVTGGAEETKAPTWDNLTAYMEADLYEKGDAIEYDVTVENRGTIDAYLENITDNIKTTNEAVKITFTGYTKGEKLYKNTSQIIKVKIEYNPEFEGKAEEGSSETSITLDYTQAEGGTVTPTDKYLVTYDCVTNGGKDCSSYNEYLKEGETVNLTYQGINSNNKFIGWNTDKDALEGLETLQMETNNITLYAIYEKDPIIRSWSSSDTSDFHSTDYKESIISVEFLDHKNIPENVVASWDVSEAKDKSVMAWVIADTNDNTKHHLYIGGNGGVIANKDSSFLFNGFQKIQTIEFNNNFDTSNTTNMAHMFNMWNDTDKSNSTGSLKQLDVSSFDTSNVTDMSGMFAFNTNLTKINFGNFNTSNVRSMVQMFAACKQLTNLNLTGFNTSKVTTMTFMFDSCENIEKLNLCSFNTDSIETMQGMFTKTQKLTKIYVGPEWNIPSGANTTSMFAYSGSTDVIKSNNCEIDAEEAVISALSTSKTTNSITVVTTATAESGIEKYEYSINGGEWISSENNTYTFTKLKNNTEYTIKVKITTKTGKVVESEEVKVTTNNFSAPTYSLSPAGDMYGQSKTVTVTAQCASCTNEYSIDEGKTWNEFPSNEFKIKYLSNNNLITRTSDGENTISSSCTITNIDSTEPGIIKINPSSKIPGGYLECNGQAVSRTKYATLFATIGTTYGTGDGSTTFNLPNLNERTVIGTNSSHAFASTGGSKTHYHAVQNHTLTIAEMPKHNHDIAFYKTTPWESDNVRPEESNAVLYGGYSNSKKGTRYAYTVADTSASAGGFVGGGGAHNHGNTENASSMQPYIAMKYIIRY